MSYRQLLEAALALPEGKRRDLARDLRASLRDQNDILFVKEWQAELNRRWQEIEQGKVKCLTLAEFKRRVDKLKKSTRTKRSAHG